MAARTVTDPQGGRWAVRRRWVKRRPRWRGKASRSIDLMDGLDAASVGAELPGVGGVVMVIAAVIVAVAALVFVVPAVIFLVELILVGALVGLGLIGRVLLRRPWTVEARQQGDECVYEWNAQGWRASEELCHSVAKQLEATGLPAGGALRPAR